MTRFHPLVALACLFVAAAVSVTAACTTFCLEGAGGPVFGRNYDWNVADCLVMVNPAGAVKTADSEEHPARWTSRYGSVTFNQYGREHPCGGMNEAGLVVELMWLDESRYPGADARAVVPTLQWIQYQLDNCTGVADVIATDEKIRIRGSNGRVHFLVADATGAVAAIEFIGGAMVVHAGEDMPYAALANDSYERSLSYLKGRRGYGGDRALEESAASLARFARAADRVRGYDHRSDGDPVAYAFATLDMVAQGPSTQWSIVYDIGERRVYARTSSNRALRYLDLDDIDFSCEGNAAFVDLQGRNEGDLVPLLQPYTTAANAALMTRAFSQTRFLAHIPEAEVRDFARYPETITCATAEGERPGERR